MWRELTINSPIADLITFSEIQVKLNVIDPCLTDGYVHRNLIPTLQKGGHIYLFEERNLTMVIGFKFMERKNRWVATHLMADPFTVLGFQKIIDTTALKLFDFMTLKGVTTILGLHLLLHKYNDLIFATTNISEVQFWDTIVERLATHNLRLSRTKEWDGDYFLIEKIGIDING